MRYETAQLLSLLGISKEALRHWKTVLAPIAGRDGRSGGYAFGEVLALALIAEANTELAVPVSRFKDVAHRFFADVAALADQGGPVHAVVCISRGDVGVHAVGNLPPSSALAIVRIDPILDRMRKRLAGVMPEPEEQQLSLDLVTPTTTGRAVAKPLRATTRAAKADAKPGGVRKKRPVLRG